MNLRELIPKPVASESFHRSRNKFVPATSGCYALTTFEGVVLYVGLATNLRSRMEQHLDDPEKTSPTEHGRAVLLHWIELPALELEKVERTWMNTHELREGVKPILNSICSPLRI